MVTVREGRFNFCSIAEPEKPAKRMTIGSKQIAKILIEDDDREIRNEKK